MGQDTKRILIVDDDEVVAKDIERTILKRGYKARIVLTSQQCFEQIELFHPDLIIMDINLNDPNIDGIELTKKIMQSINPIPVIYHTLITEDETVEKAIRTNPYGYIVKSASEIQMIASIDSALHMKEKNDLSKFIFGTLDMVSSLVEIRDPYTAGHMKNVSKLACKIAVEMGLSAQRIENLRIAGLIHDIGKLGVPVEMLSKPGGLTSNELNVLKDHVQLGYDILTKVNYPSEITEIVYQHHERINGEGYPKGISGDQIMLESKILSVADVVDSMLTHRPYRSKYTLKKTLKHIKNNSRILFDPEVVKVCSEVIVNSNRTG